MQVDSKAGRAQFDFSSRPEPISCPSFRPEPRIHPGRSGEIFHLRNKVQNIVLERFLPFDKLRAGRSAAAPLQSK